MHDSVDILPKDDKITASKEKIVENNDKGVTSLERF